MSTSAQPTPPHDSSRSPLRARAPGRDEAAPHAELRALLRGAPSLASLGDRALERLAEWCEPLDVAEGAVLFRERDECAGLYAVTSGQVRVYRVTSDGAERPIRLVGRGGVIGELPLLAGERHSASAVATEPTRLAFLSRRVVEGVYRADPDVAQAIVESLARRVRDLALRTRALAYRDVVSRLAVLLAGFAEREAKPDAITGRGVALDLGRTQEEIAHEIGAARESVSRAWGHLRDEGLIEPRRGHRVHIPDLQRLRDVAGT